MYPTCFGRRFLCWSFGSLQGRGRVVPWFLARVRGFGVLGLWTAGSTACGLVFIHPGSRGRTSLSRAAAKRGGFVCCFVIERFEATLGYIGFRDHGQCLFSDVCRRLPSLTTDAFCILRFFLLVLVCISDPLVLKPAT